MDNADQDVFSSRLKLLQRAKELRNVSAACKEFGCSRSLYYYYLKSYKEAGSSGIVEKSRRPKTNPRALDLSIQEKIFSICLENPD